MDSERASAFSIKRPALGACLVVLVPLILIGMESSAPAKRPGGVLVASFMIGSSSPGIGGSHACEILKRSGKATLWCQGLRASRSAERRCQRRSISAIGDATLRPRRPASFGTMCTGQAPFGEARLVRGGKWSSYGYLCELSANGGRLACIGPSAHGFVIDTRRNTARRIKRIRARAADGDSPATAAGRNPRRPAAICWNLKGNRRMFERRPKFCGLYPPNSPPFGHYMMGLRWEKWGAREAVGRGAAYRLWPYTRVRLSSPKRRCGRLIFTRARFRFLRTSGEGYFRPHTISLGCRWSIDRLVEFPIPGTSPAA